METIKGIGPNLKPFYYHVCKPSNDEDVKGVVLVLHGAEGHGGRYEPLGKEFVDLGYAMFSIDHINHGLSVKEGNKKYLGVWEKNDFELSTYNAYYLVDFIKKTYPGRPVYLIGDDYGGTMAQFMIGEYPNAFDGVVIVSCGMPSARDKKIFSKVVVKKALLYDGGKSNSIFKERTRFLNSHFSPTRTKYDWLNSVPEEVDRFIDDPLAGYVGTIGYYYYQYKYIVSVPGIVKFKNIDKNLPILMLGGKDDYITRRGAKIEALEEYYKNKGFTNVNTIFYDKSRHDVLLEWNKSIVAEDIVSWICSNSNIEYNRHQDKKEELQREDVRVISLKGIGEEYTAPSENKFKEEEPEDELRLSRELKDYED